VHSNNNIRWKVRGWGGFWKESATRSFWKIVCRMVCKFYF